MSSPISIYIVTANCGRAFVDRKAFSAHFFKPYSNAASQNMPDFVVLSLQEMAPMAYCFLGGVYLRPYFDRIVDTVQYAAPNTKYKHIITHNAGMTGIIILAKPAIADCIQWVQKAEVGVGMMEMGNKGAAGIRLGYAQDNLEDPFVMTFVAAHLAAGEGKVARRNKDWQDIVRGIAFEPVTNHSQPRSRELNAEGEDAEEDPLLTKPTAKMKPHNAGMFDSKSILFVAGDLNYRTSDTGPTADDFKTFPQPGDDISDSRHYSHLLQHDQLCREIQAGKTLHHLAEAPINFPPTYKYSPEEYHRSPPLLQGSDVEPTTWCWAPHRFPSWCDRILYSSYLSASSNTLKVLSYSALPVQPTTDHRPVVFAVELDTKKASLSAERHQAQYKAPFPLNPNWRRQRSAARAKEIVVGVLMYLGWTWEGNGVLLATIVGIVGSWLVLKSWTNP